MGRGGVGGGGKAYSDCETPHPVFWFSRASAQTENRPLPQGARLKCLLSVRFQYIKFSGD